MATEEKNYNGWSNYETWLVGLWLDNDQGTYNEVVDIAKFYQSKEVYQMADRLKEYVHEIIGDDEAPASLKTDLTRAALSEVDWYELAQHYREEYK